ncbi:putative oxidoreductase [Candidatus Nitrotoga sp. BS]|uniref:DoxX family protein n=1 Tax=Candidatus Nitrotoga sp. BS TaxID=2890408 RepID=UPI001EF38A19|nr:DoxX family protein [Candidatus Nitrotoga sp. BS]CAH1204072.1 putative oxidoreductase [Candidatus Nitrotoga sp. BS]
MTTENIFKQINVSIVKLVSIPAVNAPLVLAARLLASAIFISAGFSKLGAGYAGAQGYMASVGLSGELLPLVIALEMGGGLALLLGFQARLAAFALSVFCIVSGVLFHSGADPMQQIMFMKNLAMAGGLLAFTLFGAGRLSLDGETKA